jgi:hypothetical protein
LYRCLSSVYKWQLQKVMMSLITIHYYHSVNTQNHNKYNIQQCHSLMPHIIEWESGSFNIILLPKLNVTWYKRCCWFECLCKVGFYYFDKNYYEDYMDTTIFVNFCVLAPLFTNMAWVRARLCKLQKRVHSTRSRKW